MKKTLTPIGLEVTRDVPIVPEVTRVVPTCSLTTFTSDWRFWKKYYTSCGHYNFRVDGLLPPPWMHAPFRFDCTWPLVWKFRFSVPWLSINVDKWLVWWRVLPKGLDFGQMCMGLKWPPWKFGRSLRWRQLRGMQWSDVYTFKVFDINTIKLGDLDFSAPFTLTVQQQKLLHGFVVYFDIQFLKNCQQPISFSTGPFTPDTHWHQTIFILEHPVLVEPNDKIVGTISFKRNQHHRDLKITVGYSLLGKTETVEYQYTLWQLY